MSATNSNTGRCVTLPDLLRAVWPSDTAKRAATVAGKSPRSVQDWLQRRTCPDANTLLRMAAENEQLRMELLRRLGVEVNAAVDFRDQASAVSSGGVVVGETGRAGAAVEWDGRERRGVR